MAKSPEEMAAAMVANLKEKTGKTMDEWLAVAAPLKGRKHGEVVKFLKEEHGMTHGFANLVAHKLVGVMAEGAPEGDDLVAAQYEGKKAALRPVYEAVAAAAMALGADVELSPKKTYVSLRRSKQFGLVGPATATRVDLGLNLKGVEPAGRLEPAGSNTMVTHKVRLEKPADVDKEVKAWLKKAYDAA